MSKTKQNRTNHRAILNNEGPAKNPGQLVDRQIVSVRVGTDSVQRPERIYQRGETFRCTLAEAKSLGGEVSILE